MSPRDVTRLDELVEAHGDVVRDFVAAKKLPTRQLGNFFGRHSERRSAILRGMQIGQSYSKAYSISAVEFDTKRWAKVPNRVASARGLLLKGLASVVGSSSADLMTEEVRVAISELKEASIVLAANLLREPMNEQEPRKRDKPKPVSVSPLTAGALSSGLRTAVSKVSKTVRDVPRMHERLGERPSVYQVAAALADCARIVRGGELAGALANRFQKQKQSHRTDPWGVGQEYSQCFASVPRASDLRIATHKRPDADALVSAWLVDRYLLHDKNCSVHFIEKRKLQTDTFDAVVDIGNRFDPDAYRYDHKPLKDDPDRQFQTRYDECACSLVLRQIANPPAELRDFVTLIHDGDAIPRRSRSEGYQASRSNGFHAIVRAFRDYCSSDQMIYGAVSLYLDVRFRQGICDTDEEAIRGNN